MDIEGKSSNFQRVNQGFERRFSRFLVSSPAKHSHMSREAGATVEIYEVAETAEFGPVDCGKPWSCVLCSAFLNGFHGFLWILRHQNYGFYYVLLYK